MKNWNQLLSPDELAGGFIAPINDAGLIAVSGADAATFLHNQLTNDVEHLGKDEVRLAGYCTPKGRLQATFLMWRDDQSIFLQLPRELQPALQKRLSMFVLRLKATLSDATPEASVGLGGARAEAALRALFGALPDAPYRKLDHARGTLLRLADAFGAPRFQWQGKQAEIEAALPALTETLAPAASAAWDLAAIHAGVPQVTQKTQEQFVPQMVNYELLGGVNFKKGCYPGQEIVARSQYLGKLKRRTALARISADAAAGDEVFSVADPGQPCGMIVNAAPNGLGGTDVLVESTLAALEREIRLGSADGALLHILPLPYALDALEV